QVARLEESGWPNSCYDPAKQAYSDDPSVGLLAVHNLMARYGLKVPVYYVNRNSGNIEGGDWEGLKHILADADLLLNVGGVCWLPEFRLCRRRAIIDKDPLFTQVGHFGGSILNEHHFHFSYGMNIGHPACTVPCAGVNWLPTTPPVVPEIWKWQAEQPDSLFTTIGSLKAFGAVHYKGQRYGQKDEEFIRFMDLPKRTSQRLELALKDNGDVMRRLRSAGWLVRNSGEVSSDASTYQTY